MANILQSQLSQQENAARQFPAHVLLAPTEQVDGIVPDTINVAMMVCTVSFGITTKRYCSVFTAAGHSLRLKGASDVASRCLHG